MRNRFLSGAIVMCALALLVACTGNTSSVPLELTLKIKNGNAFTTSAAVFFDGKSYDIALDSTGVGSVQIDCQEEGYGYIHSMMFYHPVYFMPSKDMELFIDIKKRGEYQVKCDDGGVNEYISALKQPLHISVFKRSEAAFLNAMDSVIKVRKKELKKRSFHAEFERLQEKEIEYSTALNLLGWVKNHRAHTGNSKYVPTDAYTDVLKSYMIADKELLRTISYRTYINEGIWTVTSKEGMTKAEAVTAAVKYASTLDLGDFIENIIFKNAKYHIENQGVTGTEELQSVVVSAVKDSSKVNEFKGIVKMWAKLGKGCVSPTFNYPDINGNKVALSDLKGKYVYIDVWATWCGPCKKEIPYLQELEHEYAGRNIHFVSISTDRDMDAWRKMVVDKKLGGIQLNMDGDKTFGDEYAIKGIPKFILIDKEGKIVAANAPRPSSYGIRNLFNSLEGL